MRSTTALVLRTFRYHWAANGPVAVGVMIGAAVLTGALIVGDSLRGSLRARAERQLNGVTAGYVGPRMVRESLATALSPDTLPVLLMSGSARTTAKDGTERRLGRVTVVAPAGQTAFGLPGVMVAARVAEKLAVGVGDEIVVGVQKMSAVPRSSLLGKRSLDDVADGIKLKIGGIVAEQDPRHDFNLSPNPEPPLNVFVPLSLLQARLDLTGKVNALLSYGGTADELNVALAPKLDLADYGLRVKPAGPGQAYVSVESEQLVLDAATVAAVEKATAALGLRSERTLIYLANTIAVGEARVPNMPAKGDVGKYGSAPRPLSYSMIACLDPAAKDPLGPFLPPGVAALKDDEIALTTWDQSPLKSLQIGSKLTVGYFKPEMEVTVEEAWATFKFVGRVPFTGLAQDRDLTPPFPGITDKPKIRGNRGEQWEAPFELNYARIGQADEDYWETYRATPKAYITRAAGEKLFGSRFGSVTSIRVAPADGETAEATVQRLRVELRKHLDPAAVGLRFEPFRERFLAASKGGTDFGMMLLAFSFLLILAALLLVGMLFRLAVDRRAKEVGLLLATGYSPGTVRNMLLAEAGVVAVVGAAVGVGLAVLYAGGMLRVLTALWPDANVGSYLTLHVGAASLVIGFVATCLVAVFAIWLGVRALVKVPPPQLLRGQTEVAELEAKPVTPRRSAVLSAACALLGVGLVVGGRWVGNADMRAGSFFGGGFLLLLSGLFLFRAWLRRAPTAVASVPGLGLRNATRSASRSLLTVTLLSLATFLLVAVESFRKKPGAGFAEPSGGSGGFALIAEADVPVFQPFDREPGAGDFLGKLQDAFGGASTDPRYQKAKTDLAELKLTAMPFRLRGGDDASCLNLYQAGRPRVVGVPDELIPMNRFSFAMTEAETPEEKANPWLLLAKPRTDGAIPIFVEQNTAMWMLKTFLGGTVAVPDEAGRAVKLRIVGTFQDSVFQSELTMSDKNFRDLYPREEGFRLFLIDAPADKLDRATELLETGLQGNGFVVSRTADKVAAYQAVIGAYLSTFQLLGGLGLLLGVCGLGVVILRGVWERRSELAVLRAVGYRPRTLVRLVLVENLLLLIAGLGIGLVAAVLSVLPNLQLGGQFDAPRLGLLLGAVFVVGFAVAVWATRSAARAPLIPALRRE